MGSRTPHGHGKQAYDVPRMDESSNSGGQSRRNHLARAGDGCIGSNGAGDGSDDSDGDNNGEAYAAPSTLIHDGAFSAIQGKKKKRSKKSKKKRQSSLKQSSPPRVPVDDLFKSGIFPIGQLMDYSTSHEKTTSSITSKLHRVLGPDLEDIAFLNSYRKAAEVHRQTRTWVQEFAQPGRSLTEIATGIDANVRALLGNAGLETGQGLESGLGFPTGLCLNDLVAHYTPNPGFKDIVLQHNDVMKVDFGVHINGWIVDSAFTMSFDPTYDNLLAAVKDATNTGIKTAGIDVRVSDVSAAIQEAMESYEVEINGKTCTVKAVRNITGHNIKQYRIHGGKSIPFVKNNDQTKMEEGEVFAIETFGTTGKGWLRDGDGFYGYGLPDHSPQRVSLPIASANRLYKTIKENFGTLVFCRRQLEHLGCERYLAGLHSLVSNGILDDYKPLVDVKGSYSAQFEHTILLRERCKEVISRGDDY